MTVAVIEATTATTGILERHPLRSMDIELAVDRRRLGRSVREAVPRRSLASIGDAARRPDPVDVLEEQGRSRVQALLPIRHARMAASPFAFLRGAAAVMAADLAATASTGIPVQLCGDAHIANFGAFATPERTLVFDVNDLDETHAGPFEWDVKRYAASVAVAARDRGDRPAAAEAVTRGAIEAYRVAIDEAAAMGVLAAWYQRIDVAAILAAARGRARDGAAARTVARARGHVERESQRRTSTGSRDRLAMRVDGAWRFREEPPLVRRHGLDGPVGVEVQAFYERYLASLRGELRVLLSLYRPVDLARRVVGVGSVGTEAFVLLLESRREDDVLFLQMKQAQASVIAPFVEGPAVIGTSEIRSEGERVVVGQRLIQSASDPFLGWADGGPGGAQDFYVRQLRDMKVSADIATMTSGVFATHAKLCAQALAFAHARSGTASAISGYIGGGGRFTDAITAFALAYADRTIEDHAGLVAAIASGRLPADLPAGPRS